VHDPPFQSSLNGREPSMPVRTPTAMHSVEDQHETSRRRYRSLLLPAGRVCAVHFVPSQLSAKGEDPSKLLGSPSPTAMHAVGEAQVMPLSAGPTGSTNFATRVRPLPSDVGSAHFSSGNWGSLV